MDERIKIHGACVAIRRDEPAAGAGKGVLLLGEAGAGKSETALELVSRGHALVADDVVVLRRDTSGLVASPVPAWRGLLHIRDVGVINVASVYGTARVLSSCRIAVCVALDSAWNAIPQALPDDAENVATWLGITVPRYRLCAAHSRSIPSIVEAIASGGVIDTNAISPLVISGCMTQGVWRKALA